MAGQKTKKRENLLCTNEESKLWQYHLSCRHSQLWNPSTIYINKWEMRHMLPTRLFTKLCGLECVKEKKYLHH